MNLAFGFGVKCGLDLAQFPCSGVNTVTKCLSICAANEYEDNSTVQQTHCKALKENFVLDYLIDAKERLANCKMTVSSHLCSSVSNSQSKYR